jgi:hypothetical protein
MKRRVLAVALSSLAVIAATAAVIIPAAYGSSKGGSTVKTRKDAQFGTILVNAFGQTLYLNTSHRVPCRGGCPFEPFTTTGKPKAEGGAKASLLGTHKLFRSTQVTYNHHALYVDAGESAGQVSGEGHDTEFYVVNPSGNPVTQPTNSSSATTTSSSSTG